MEKRIRLTIEYKNGGTLKQLVNYVHFEDGSIYYTIDKQVHGAFQQQIKTPLENVNKFDVQVVDCDGWKIVGED